MKPGDILRYKKALKDPTYNIRVKAVIEDIVAIERIGKIDWVTIESLKEYKK